MIKHEPFAKNGLPSDYLFVQRKYYTLEQRIYPNISPKPIDMWFKRPLYGKVDTYGRFVYPNKANLKPIRENHYVVNFVADAYTDFANIIESAVRTDRTCISSFIDVTKPTKAWEDLTTVYHKHYTNNIGQTFGNLLANDKNKLNKMIDFKDYMKYFIDFVSNNATFEFTKAAYLSSNKVSNRCSGLVIEFSNDPYDDDNLKWTKYISNDFFEEYVKIAGAYGFYINKHVPWSIVANFNSKAMKKYMRRYNLYTTSQVFRKNYLQSEYISFETFKKYLFAGYATLIGLKPYIETTTYNNKIRSTTMSSQYNTKFSKRPRKVEFQNASITELRPEAPRYSEFVDIYSEKYLFRKYIEVRLIEMGINNSATKKKIIKTAFTILAKKGIYEATIFLSEAFLSQKNYLTSLKENNSL